MIVSKVEYDELQERSDIVRDLCVILKAKVPTLLKAVEKLKEENEAMYAKIHKIKRRPYPARKEPKPEEEEE